MNPRSLATSFTTLVTLGVALVAGCGHRSATSAADQAVSAQPWTNQLENYRSEILTGTWVRAETLWAKLSYKTNWTDAEMERWIRFQTEILQQTKDDALKTPLRHSAMQQIYWHPEASRSYLGWLKDGLATNLFSDPITSQKAREAVQELEKSQR